MDSQPHSQQVKVSNEFSTKSVVVRLCRHESTKDIRFTYPIPMLTRLEVTTLIVVDLFELPKQLVVIHKPANQGMELRRMKRG